MDKRILHVLVYDVEKSAKCRASYKLRRVDTPDPTTSLESRICKFCTVVENEVHFISECYFYDDLRMNFDLQFYNSCGPKDLFIKMFTEKNKKTIKSICTFVRNLFFFYVSYLHDFTFEFPVSQKLAGCLRNFYMYILCVFMIHS